MMNEYIGAVMTKDVVTLTPNDSLKNARQIMIDRHIHHIPIVEGKKLVGMVASWDLFKIGKSTEDYADMKCSEIMVTHLATLEPDQHLGAAAMVLMEHLFHAIPIVNDDKELVGIVSTYDLLKYEYSKEYPSSLDKFIPENML